MHLVFDSDGVLYPTTQLSLREITEALIKASASLGLTKDHWQQAKGVCQSSGHRGMVNFINQLACLGGHSPHDIYAAHAQHIHYAQITPNQALLQALIKARKQGYSLALASNNHRPHLECVIKKVLGSQGLDLFADIITGHSFIGTRGYASKPQAGYFEGLLQRLGSSPDTLHFFDDTLANTQTAKALGINVHHIKKGCCLNEAIKALL